MNEEELYERAIDLVVENQRASTSYVHRNLQVGYATAAYLVEKMVQDGIVSEPNFIGKREVLKQPPVRREK